MEERLQYFDKIFEEQEERAREREKKYADLWAKFTPEEKAEIMKKYKEDRWDVED